MKKKKMRKLINLLCVALANNLILVKSADGSWITIAQAEKMTIENNKLQNWRL